MKRFYTITLSVIMLLVCFTSCAEKDSTTASTTSQDSINSDNALIQDGNNIYAGYTDNSESTVEYNGEALEFHFNVNLPEGNSAAPVIFVNGYVQPYTVEGEDNSYVEKLDNGSYALSNGKYTVKFHPVTGKAGETVECVLCTLYKPDFKEPYDKFQTNHKFGANLIKEIVMKADAPTETPEIETNTYLKEIEDVFINMSGIGENGTEEMTQTDFRIYDVVLSESQFNSKRQSEIYAKRNTEHKITICGYGMTGKYRVALFINDELQSVFDGKSYLDMSIEKDMQTTYSFKIDTSDLNDENYIYLIYYPLDANTDDSLFSIRKTYSSIFYVWETNEAD